jgi:hypothetical protein
MDPREFETPEDAREFMMINSLTRIAKDLERVIVGIFASVGLLGLIAGLLLLRLMIGR